MEREQAHTPIQRDVIDQVQVAVLDIMNPIVEQMELLRKRLDNLQVGDQHQNRDEILLNLNDTPIRNRPPRRSATLKKEGSSSDSSGGDKSDEEELFEARKSSRRKSILEQDLNRGVTSSQLLRTPKCSDILRDFDMCLEDISVEAFVKFCNDVTAYQNTVRGAMNVSKFISKRVTKFLICSGGSRYYNLDEDMFRSLSFDSIQKLMKYSMMPESKADLVSAVDEAVHFPKLPRSYSFPGDDCEVFYKALFGYVELFKAVVDFLSMGDQRHKPSFNLKKHGLVHVFVRKIPFNYGFESLRHVSEQFYNVEKMSQEFIAIWNRDRDKAKCTSLQEFVFTDGSYDFMKAMQEISERTRNICLREPQYVDTVTNSVLVEAAHTVLSVNSECDSSFGDAVRVGYVNPSSEFCAVDGRAQVEAFSTVDNLENLPVKSFAVESVFIGGEVRHGMTDHGISEFLGQDPLVHLVKLSEFAYCKCDMSDIEVSSAVEVVHGNAVQNDPAISMDVPCLSVNKCTDILNDISADKSAIANDCSSLDAFEVQEHFVRAVVDGPDTEVKSVVIPLCASEDQMDIRNLVGNLLSDESACVSSDVVVSVVELVIKDTSTYVPVSDRVLFHDGHLSSEIVGPSTRIGAIIDSSCDLKFPQNLILTGSLFVDASTNVVNVGVPLLSVVVEEHHLLTEKQYLEREQNLVFSNAKLDGKPSFQSARKIFSVTYVYLLQNSVLHLSVRWSHASGLADDVMSDLNAVYLNNIYKDFVVMIEPEPPPFILNEHVVPDYTAQTNIMRLLRAT